MAYGHTFFVPRTIDNSVITQVNPIEPHDPELANVVGNGRYESALDVVGISISAEIPTRSRRDSSEENETNEPERSPDDDTNADDAPREREDEDSPPSEDVSPIESDGEDEFDTEGFEDL